MEAQEKILNDITQSEYKYGFVTEIETDIIDKGLYTIPTEVDSNDQRLGIELVKPKRRSHLIFRQIFNCLRKSLR